MGTYAAYGINLDPEQMRRKAPHSPVIGSGWLAGWRLTFGAEEHSWQGALPTVVEEPGSTVYVMLYALTDEDEENLDSAEGFDLGMYSKIRVRVSTLDRDVTAWLYTVNGYEGGLPTTQTVSNIIASAIIAGAPDDYVEQLRNRPTAEEAE